MKKRIECPYCDGMASLQKEKKELTYRKDQFTIVAHFYKCEKCDEEFTTTETDNISLIQAYNQYRQKYSIPFPEEIAAIRDKYDLSAAKMSEVLGLGANGYSNYEKGEMPVPAMAKLIATAAKPEIFMEFLKDARSHFSDNTFEKAKMKVESLIEKDKEFNPFYSSINIYKDPNSFTGYKRPDAKKIISLISQFIKKCKPEFNDKLKLNKLLFYTDFCHYKNYGSSVSGLSYRAIQYGPVPANYDNIYAFLENDRVITAEWIRLPNGSAREVFKIETETKVSTDARSKDITDAKHEDSLFAPDEQETINAVIHQFSNTSTWDIVDLSHKEKAWKDLEAGKELISYQDYAFDLKTI